jgi:hypothetical protein
MGLPGMITLVFVYTELVGLYQLLSEVWNDDGNMAFYANHGVSLIRSALDWPARMGMNIRQYIQILLATGLPKIWKVSPIENNNACVQAVRVNVVVKYEPDYPAFIALAPAKEKGAAFTAPHAASFQLLQPGLPELGGTADAVLRGREVPYNRSK